MKKIEAIIRPEKLVDVRSALLEASIRGITVYDVKGKGHQKDLILHFRGKQIGIGLLPKTKIELFVTDANVDKVIGILKKSAHTGNIGDGKIIILPMENIIKIRTGEQGKDAINNHKKNNNDL